MDIGEVRLATNAVLDNERLSALFLSAWPSQQRRDFAPVLARSLVHVSAWIDDELVGFVNVATDGGEHAFLLDTTVHPEFRRRGIGAALVRRAVAEARSLGASWMHVDFVSQLEQFYRAAGFRHTTAGLIDLRDG